MTNDDAVERREALMEYEIAMGELAVARTREPGKELKSAIIGVRCGFMLGVRLALRYPDIARSLSQQVENGEGLGETGLGEAMEVWLGKVADAIGGDL